MAALSANRNIDLKNTQNIVWDSMPVETAEVLYKHGLVVALDDGETCHSARNSTSDRFIGMAKQQYTGDGADGVSAEVFRNVWANLPTTGLTAGDIGTLVYCADDNKVTSATTLGPVCGIYQQESTTNNAWIWVGPGAVLAKAS